MGRLRPQSLLFVSDPLVIDYPFVLLIGCHRGLCHVAVKTRILTVVLYLEPMSA